MAKIASETRIYRETKKFLNEVIYVIKDFPKEQRYVVGDRIERTAIDSLHIIARVYMGRNLKERIADMTELQSNLELLNTLIEIAGEHHWNRVGGKRSSFSPTFVFRPLTPPYMRFRIRRFLFWIPFEV